jgi:lipid A ethanolaminephosphotransferase
MQIGTRPVSLLAGIFLVLFTNDTFWSKAWAYLDNGFIAVGGLAVAVLAVLYCLLNLACVKYLAKPLLIATILVAVSASYFIDTFGIVIDADMMHNLFQTDWREASDLLGPGFLFHLAVFAVPPIAFISWVKIRYDRWRTALWQNGLNAAACLLVSAVVLLSNFSGYASAVRNHRDLLASFNPGAPIDAFVKYLAEAAPVQDRILASVGADARLGAMISAKRKKTLVVFVLGETARGQSFSLNGYGRPTNPQLAKHDVISFRNVSSCGTATEISVPCMFSPFGRADYSRARASATENLIDVLKHAGMELAWWDNNTGSKGVADRIAYRSLRKSRDERFCKGKTCLDDILLDRLKAHLPAITGNAFLVLHQLGSHGPAYHQRYPDHFGPFEPACSTAELSSCSRDEIVNAYDNTIAYTDRSLGNVIDYLQTLEKEFDTALVYVSDHGESTGEYGLYLHGMPYAIAPKSQTEVPFILWFSDGFRRSMSLDEDCLRAHADRPYSHDNLFHSMLGLMNIETEAYQAELDLFAGCREDVHISARTPARDTVGGFDQAWR